MTSEAGDEEASSAAATTTFQDSKSKGRLYSYLNELRNVWLSRSTFAGPPKATTSPGASAQGPLGMRLPFTYVPLSVFLSVT